MIVFLMSGKYEDEIKSQSRCRLLTFLHSMPPSATFPIINTESVLWSDVLYDESVPLTFNAKNEKVSTTSSSKLIYIDAFSSGSIKQNWFLNIGAPIWSLDISSPYHSLEHSIERPPKRIKTETQSIDNFTVLAVGLSPWSHPVSLSQSDPLDGSSVIQLWRISMNPSVMPQMSCGLLHNVSQL